MTLAPTLAPAPALGNWVCVKGECTYPQEEHHLGEPGVYATYEDCRQHCKTELSGVVWVWIIVACLILMGLLLVVVMKGKGGKGAGDLFYDLGEVVAEGVSNVADSVNSNN